MVNFYPRISLFTYPLLSLEKFAIHPDSSTGEHWAIGFTPGIGSGNNSLRGGGAFKVQTDIHSFIQAILIVE